MTTTPDPADPLDPSRFSYRSEADTEIDFTRASEGYLAGLDFHLWEEYITRNRPSDDTTTVVRVEIHALLTFIARLREASARIAQLERVRQAARTVAMVDYGMLGAYEPDGMRMLRAALADANER